MNKYIHLLFVILLVFDSCFGSEYIKQRYNQNTDFLLHETNENLNSPKKDTNYGSFQNTQINQHDFPPLRSPSASSPPQQPVSGQTTKKPDFPPLSSTVTSPRPNVNTHGSTQSGKRDYVAPQMPSLNQNSGKSGPTITTTSSRPNVNTHGSTQSGKRDYVAPQMPSTNQNSGKVKDLINFYDGKNQQNGPPQGPQKVPSYSSIVQGSGTNAKPTPSTTKVVQPVTQSSTTNNTPRPISFSSIVAGSSSIGTTVKPSTRGPFTTSTPSVRPGSPILPSSIANNNRRDQINNRNGPTDTELQTLTEELLRKDTNNAAKYITINYQEKTSSQSKEDKAPNPLLTITNAAWNIPTIEKFLPLLDNYERDTLVNEYVTPQERNEENAFMDVIMSTSVIRHLMTFLKDKGYVTPDPKQQRDFLKQLWFSLYSRGKGKISSSGFEHIFVSELKNGEVSGLHNWIYFSREEAASRANYLGYLKYLQLNDKGAVLKLHFTQQGVDKPVDTMFIGTSPELEIALYTLCFVTRADNDCNIKLVGKDVNIVTHTFRYRSKNLIGSAYPQF